MSKLHSLPAATTNKKKRVGRGYGSGVGGHTVGRGSKGQLARNSVPLWFEGGQLPLIKRLPMLRGKGRLKALFKPEMITLTQLSKVEGAVANLETLKAAKVIHRDTTKVKVVATGEITKKLTVEGVKLSGTARQAIEKAGGSITE